jgi:hypothetical protein
MAGWDTANGTSVTATERLRAALRGQRRARAANREVMLEETAEACDQLREERISVVSEYIGAYPEDEPARRRCNGAFHHADDQPLVCAAG